MTALVMSSEVDLAIDRILSDRNATSSNTDADSDITNTSEEGAIGQALTTVFGNSVAICSPGSKLDESVMDYKSASNRRPQIDDAGKRPGGGREKEKEKVTEIAKSVFDTLIEDAILSLVFEAHRAAKTGLFSLYESTDIEDDEDLRIIDDEHCYADIFGQALISNSKTSKGLAQLECVCPQCHQSRLACRFAPHLEKCMGMGRNSSRLASRRLAASASASKMSNSASARRNDSATFNGGGSSDEADGDDDQLANDDDDDDDWTGDNGGSQFGKRRSQRKRASGISGNRTPKKRGGLRISPKKPSGLRSGGALFGDILLNEGASKGDGARKLRKTSSLAKLPSAGQQPYDFDMGEGANDFLSLGDSYDPPSPSF